MQGVHGQVIEHTKTGVKIMRRICDRDKSEKKRTRRRDGTVRPYWRWQEDEWSPLAVVVPDYNVRSA